MPRKTWRAALAAYASPSTLVLLLLGFAAGLPYMLVFSTLSVWLREAGVARETIGYASLMAWPTPSNGSGHRCSTNGACLYWASWAAAVRGWCSRSR